MIHVNLCVKVKLLSRVRLFAIPWSVVYQASPDPGIEPRSPALYPSCGSRCCQHPGGGSGARRATEPPLRPAVLTGSAHGAPRGPGPRRHAMWPEAVRGAGLQVDRGMGPGTDRLQAERAGEHRVGAPEGTGLWPRRHWVLFLAFLQLPC